MNKIKILIIALIASCNISFAQILVENGDEICQELKDAFMDPNLDVVCIIKIDPLTADYFVTIDDCQLVIVDKELKIPANTSLILTGGSSISLVGNSNITGEHFQTSQIIVGDDGNSTPDQDYTAIDMDGCNGCIVSEITITKDADDMEDDNVTGIEMGGVGNNEINAVKFNGIENGIIVSSDHNTFNELQFFEVGVMDDGDCIGGNNDKMAIQLDEANSNVFNNILHTRSSGAVSLWLEGICNGNLVQNLTVEQEGGHCSSLLDPALYMMNAMSSDNVIICNFNHAKVEVPGGFFGFYCLNNTISVLDNCNNANLAVGCPGN